MNAWVFLGRRIKDTPSPSPDTPKVWRLKAPAGHTDNGIEALVRRQSGGRFHREDAQPRTFVTKQEAKRNTRQTL